MNRFQQTLAFAAFSALALSACSRNRDIPSQLAPSRMTMIGVNSYLWRAAVDTLSFAPLVQADSNGGVIVTDWYSSPRSPASGSS